MKYFLLSITLFSSCLFAQEDYPEKLLQEHIQICMTYIDNVIQSHSHENDYQRGYQQGLYEAYRDINDLIELLYID
jgi:hypothetical protein